MKNYFTDSDIFVLLSPLENGNLSSFFENCSSRILSKKIPRIDTVFFHWQARFNLIESQEWEKQAEKVQALLVLIMDIRVFIIEKSEAKKMQRKKEMQNFRVLCKEAVQEFAQSVQQNQDAFFEDIRNAIYLLQNLHQINSNDLAKSFADFSNQEIPDHVINDFKCSSLANEDFLTSDFLNKYGLKNLLQL